MTVSDYINNINQRYKLGNATEHTFRGDLQQLLESLVPSITATNEPKRQSCGAPDYILTKKDIPVGFIEAKDIGDKDLEGAKKTGNKEQFDRYKSSLDNLIFTDYIHFYFYRNGELISKISIGEITDKGIKPLTENFASFENHIKDFCNHVGQTIKSSKKLAEMMAGKARLLSDVIGKALTSDEIHHENSTLKDQMTAFKEILIHDITPQGFADVYAQTIAYGMFAARNHDPTLPTFSRQEAYELIPKSNPFLKKLFGYIAGLDVDDRIRWIVDDLVQIFLACNVEEMLKDYGKATKMEDPIIHFYEDFLSEYDPKLRKARGVWYTPQPVVNFIVRAVDDLLKTEFNLPQGLADTSKIKIKIDQQGKKIEQEVHKVQILDPATGTGTFLAEVVKHIHKKFQGQQGVWSKYVETHLLPRLNGFELLMASYAMAHLKLDLLLSETGYQTTTNQRFKIYLTNSLEESHPDTGTLFANWLSQEANEANHIKRDTPVMCVIGNPPYSVSSTNKSPWIDNLMKDYKQGLDDNNIQPLSDDYLKFIRFGQYLVEKNGEGIVAYISNNSFLDSVIHRQMRKQLLEVFDKMYVIDLHGSTKKNETTHLGTKDENVFDIQQGVSINIFIKKNKNKNIYCKLHKFDIYGSRQYKYDFLEKNDVKSISWNILSPQPERYYFKELDSLKQKSYTDFISINELFLHSGAGVQTKRDNLFVSMDRDSLKSRIIKVLNNELNASEKTNLNIKNSSSYRLLEKINAAIFSEKYFIKYNYRVFDNRTIYYDKNLVGRAFYTVMKHMLHDNLSILTCKQQSSFDFQHAFITKQVTDHNSISLQTSEATHAFPLYLYPEPIVQAEPPLKYRLDEQELLELRREELSLLVESSEKSFKTIQKMYDEVVNPDAEIQKLYKVQHKSLQKLKTELQEVQDKLIEQHLPKSHVNELFYAQQRVPNLNKLFVQKISDKLNLTFTNEKDTSISNELSHTFAPIDILDYIYAVLHSPSYREKYKEFLKIDFPRVPYPKNKDTFWKLVQLGGELRQIHLLESPVVENYITQYPEDGDNVVRKPRFISTSHNERGGLHNELGKVYINDTQYFDNVPHVAWEFYIGGYQPAQKWLKDRKDRTLEFDDIVHYQKIIVALTETDRLMKEINTIAIE